MRRLFNILLGALAMIAVALLSAFITMRLAIHGREVEVPNLANLTVQEAIDQTTQAGLSLNVENRFYSTVTPAGRILSQSPNAGAKVRREWAVRVTESLGPQRVSVPNVIGQTERTAAVSIRRLSLELGTVAYIPAPGPPGIVLTQSPTPAAAGIDGPRISLLVSESEGTTGHSPAPADLSLTQSPDANAAASALAAGLPTSAISAEPASASAAKAYVMPNLVGLSLSAASARVTAIGLHITSIEALPAAVKPIASVPSPTAPGAASGLRPVTPLAPITLSNTVVSQNPAAGRRVSKGDSIHIALSH
jgi:eukaryotic-like serine/threonine-protein kinase